MARPTCVTTANQYTTFFIFIPSGTHHSIARCLTPPAVYVGVKRGSYKDKVSFLAPGQASFGNLALSLNSSHVDVRPHRRVPVLADNFVR